MHLPTIAKSGAPLSRPRLEGCIIFVWRLWSLIRKLIDQAEVGELNA
jgi:hypothetical protein